MGFTPSARSGGTADTFLGLEDVILATLMGFPNRDVYVDILRNGGKFSFEFMKTRAPSLSEKPAPSSVHIGYLFSKHLRSAFDNDFERALQPSIYDLRSMYESGDRVRSFLATNGFGWAFRLFDFQDMSLAEFDWLDYGFIKAMRLRESLKHFSNIMPRRTALGMLRRDERAVRFLANESKAVRTRINRLQLTYGRIPSDILAKLLFNCASSVIVCEAYLRLDELRSDEVFEHHLIEALESVTRGDEETAFHDVLSFSLPSVHSLARLERGEIKLRKIKEIDFRLDQLRLPPVPESTRLNALVAFLKDMLESAYSLLKLGPKKVEIFLKNNIESGKLHVQSINRYLPRQPRTGEQQVFDGMRDFMAKAVQSYPNTVLGRIRKDSQASTLYVITDLRVLPCDVIVEYSASPRDKNPRGGPQGLDTCVGRAISKTCCSDHEMLPLLHPDSRMLHEMLRSGYRFNAIAVTDGDRCLLRLHDGSNNTVASAQIA
jgi:hypothetical protein